MLQRRVLLSVLNLRYCHLRLTKQEPNKMTKMQAAYFRQSEGEEQFLFTFLFSDDTLGFSRQFNFCRKLSETVGEFVGRITSSVDKIVEKKRKKKKKPEGAQAEVLEKVVVQLLLNDSPVSEEEICGNILCNNSEVILRVMDKDYIITVNAPWVRNVTLPNSIMAGFPVYPCKLDTLFTDVSLSIFNWYKNVDIPTERAETKIDNRENWEAVGCGFYYTPTSNDIGHRLKLQCIPKCKSSEGPAVHMLSRNNVEAGPGPCPFERRHVFTSNRLGHKSFRAVSYNILAGLYSDTDVAQTQLFAHCPPYALDIDYRKQLILKEILGYNADVICLQEVDPKVFENDLIPVLSSVGLDGVFNRKGGGSVGEGVACFFHKSKFSLLDSNCVLLGEEFKTNSRFGELLSKVSENEALATRMIERTTSLQCALLQSVEDPSKCLIVGNTHFYFHPNADHIRLLQGGVTITYMEEFLAKCVSLHPDKEISILLCGDFNSTPDCGVYQLITTGNVTDDCIDWSSKEDEAVKGLSFSHSLHLSSACGTPDFTNYTIGFHGCLDYIYYQTDNLEVTQVVPLPSEEEVTLHIALPNVVFPSDHLALVADLKWKQ